MPKMFGAKFPLQVKRQKINFASGITSIGAGVTAYPPCCGKSGERVALGVGIANELWDNWLVTRPGILRNLFVKSNSAPGAGQSYTYTVRVNGVNTALTATISGAAQYFNTDLVNTVPVNVGDRIIVQIVTSVTATACVHSASVDFEVNMVRQVYNSINFGPGGMSQAANTTRYLASLNEAPLAGLLCPNETDVFAVHLVVRKGSFRNMVGFAAAAPGAGESFVYTMRVNGANTALTVTISGAVQQTGIDTTNIVVVNSGDRVTVSSVTSVTAVACAHHTAFDFEEGDYRTG